MQGERRLNLKRHLYPLVIIYWACERICVFDMHGSAEHSDEKSGSFRDARLNCSSIVYTAHLVPAQQLMLFTCSGARWVDFQTRDTALCNRNRDWRRDRYPGERILAFAYYLAY